MRLLNLIEENHTVWFAAYSLGQLTTFIVSYIPWRRTDQTGYAKLFLIFTHINSGHHRLVIEQILSQSLGKFRLTYTGSAEEDEAGDRTLRILQAGTAAANGITYSGDSLVLSDDSLVEFFLQVEQFLTLALHHTAYWYSGPAAYNLSDIISSNFLSDHRCATLCTLQLLLDLLDVILERLQFRIADFSYAFVIAFALHAFSLKLQVFYLLLILLNLVDERFFAFPFSTEVMFLILQFCNFLIQLLNLRLVILALDGLTLNLQLLQVAGNLIQFFWYRVTLHSQFGCCLIHQVDSLIREESVRDVSL